MPHPRLNIRRDCPHGGRHQHGTERAYTADKCRCNPCADARSARDKRRRKLIAYGRWEKALVDAAPAREHLLALRERGIGWNRAAELTGLSPATTSKIVEGRQQTCERATAAAILAIPLTAQPFDKAYVDGTGTRRRVQALACLGWSLPAQLERLGRTQRGGMQKILKGGKVTAATAKAVRELYEELWDESPEPATHAEKCAVGKTLKWAASKGWAPPLAWDDETIDDPDAQPADAGRKERKLKAGADLVEDIEFLYRTGANPETAAKRVGMKPGSLADALRRQGRLDLSAWVTGWVENPQEFKPLTRKADRAPRQSNAA